MSYNYGYGINISADGKVTPYGNYSASLCLKKVDNKETSLMTDTAAAKKKAEAARYNAEFGSPARPYITPQMTAITSDMSGETHQPTSAEMYGQIMNDPVTGEKTNEAWDQYHHYTEVKNTLESEGLLGDFYKQQMQNFHDDGEFVSVTIEGVKFKFPKAEYYIPSDPNSSTLTDSHGNTNIYLAIKNLASDTAIYMVDKAQSEGWSEVEINSMWRPNAQPHTSGYAFDIGAITKNGETVYFKNTDKIGETTFRDQYNAHSGLVDEVYSSLKSDPRVTQILNPDYLFSTVPGNSYDLPNDPDNLYLYIDPLKEPDLYEKFNSLMVEHDTHVHITLYHR